MDIAVVGRVQRRDLGGTERLVRSVQDAERCPAVDAGVGRGRHVDGREPDAAEHVTVRIARQHQRRDRCHLDRFGAGRLPAGANPVDEMVVAGVQHVPRRDVAQRRFVAAEVGRSQGVTGDELHAVDHEPVADVRGACDLPSAKRVRVWLTDRRLVEHPDLVFGVDPQQLGPDVGPEGPAQDVQQVAVVHVMQRLDRVVIQGQSLRRLRRTHSTMSGRNPPSNSGRARIACPACEKMSYERESLVIVPPAVTSRVP